MSKYPVRVIVARDYRAFRKTCKALNLKPGQVHFVQQHDEIGLDKVTKGLYAEQVFPKMLGRHLGLPPVPEEE